MSRMCSVPFDSLTARSCCFAWVHVFQNSIELTALGVTFTEVEYMCDRSVKSHTSILPSAFETISTPGRVGDHLPLVRYALERGEEKSGFFKPDCHKLNDQSLTLRITSGKKGD